jgi:hypothetical protein
VGRGGGQLALDLAWNSGHKSALLRRPYVCNSYGMKTARRLTIIVTCVVIVGLTGWFVLLQWDRASWLATIVAALAAVAAVGVAVWAALREPSSGTKILEARGTGDAVANSGGDANTGIKAGVDSEVPPASSIRAADTGGASATRRGRANTGIDLTSKDQKES